MAKRGRPPKLDENGNKIVKETGPKKYEAIYWVPEPNEETFFIPNLTEIKIMWMNKEKNPEAGERIRLSPTKEGGREGSKFGIFGENIQRSKGDLIAFLAAKGEEINSAAEQRLEHNRKMLDEYYEELAHI